jgi:hypothetical protein
MSACGQRHHRQELDDETFVRLERLSRKAAHDSLSAHGGHLSDDQFDSLAVHLLEIGVKAFCRYDVSAAGGISPETYAYRRMRGYRRGRITDGPYIDWLRTHVRDSRFEPASATMLTELGDLPELAFGAEPELEDVVEHLAGGLAEREAWTLRHVAAAIAQGVTLIEVVEGLLADLADALGPALGLSRRSTISARDLGAFEELFTDWLKEAA